MMSSEEVTLLSQHEDIIFEVTKKDTETQPRALNEANWTW